MDTTVSDIWCSTWRCWRRRTGTWNISIWSGIHVSWNSVACVSGWGSSHVQRIRSNCQPSLSLLVEASLCFTSTAVNCRNTFLMTCGLITSISLTNGNVILKRGIFFWGLRFQLLLVSMLKVCKICKPPAHRQMIVLPTTFDLIQLVHYGPLLVKEEVGSGTVVVRRRHRECLLVWVLELWWEWVAYHRKSKRRKKQQALPLKHFHSVAREASFIKCSYWIIW